MKRKEEWPSLSISELEEEITIRLKLHGDMVGTLYPGIVLGEVAALRELKAIRNKFFGPVG